MSPSDLPFPVYLLNFPFTVSNAVINNELMEAYREQSFNHEVAFRQWMGLYKELVSRGALVYILPSEGNFQDQVLR
jgi:N-dimethylarginine dimethylaminohydrolase